MSDTQDGNAISDEVQRLQRVWNGQAAYSEEFHEVVTVIDVHEPLCREVAAGIVPIEIKRQNGDVETTQLNTVEGNAVEGASVAIDADPAEARELIAVLEAGISAVEGDDVDEEIAPATEIGDVERAAYARALRQAVRDQHKRINNALTTRAASWGAE